MNQFNDLLLVELNDLLEYSGFFGRRGLLDEAAALGDEAAAIGASAVFSLSGSAELTAFMHSLRPGAFLSLVFNGEAQSM